MLISNLKKTILRIQKSQTNFLYYFFGSESDGNLQKTDQKKKIDRFSLSPHAFWLTQGKGTERPFTGDYWFTKEIGHYECVGCSKKLFLSEHKFFPPTGIASFWTHLPNSIEIVSDLEDTQENFDNILSIHYNKENQKRQRCQCSTCKSHLGFVYLDGPPPTFLRFSINSGGIVFKDKPWFEDPAKIREKRKKIYLQEKRKKELIENQQISIKLDKEKYYDIIEKDKNKTQKKEN